MVFESMTACLITVGLFTYYSRRYGLGKDVPVDPTAKATVWANECLQVLKQKLSRAEIRQLQADSLHFEGAGGKGRLWCQDGHLMIQLPEQPEQQLSHPGETVSLTFEKLSETGLLAKIRVTVPPDGSHDVGVRLEVSYAS